MIPLLIRLAINAVALAVAAWLLPGIQFGPGDNNFVALIVVALIFGLLNAILKPILALLTCPLYILTLGLFTFVMNALILLLTSWIAERIGFDFSVDGFVTALIGAIIISIVSIFANMIFR